MMILLERQELELRQRLELIIAELVQLGDVLTEQANLKISTTLLQPNRQASVSAMTAMVQEPAIPDPQSKQASADDESAGSKNDPEQQRKLMLLRAQQSVVQGDKSHSELVGLAGLVNDIRLQMINNRIDLVDRQNQLNDKVYQPMQRTISGEMQTLRSRLTQFQTAAMSPSGGSQQAALAVHDNERVLAALNEIVANMLDSAGFNEVVNELRGFRDQQEELLKATQQKTQHGSERSPSINGAYHDSSHLVQEFVQLAASGLGGLAVRV